MQSQDSHGQKTHERARCYDCGAVRHGKMNKSNDNLYPPYNDEED